MPAVAVLRTCLCFECELNLLILVDSDCIGGCVSTSVCFVCIILDMEGT